MAIQQMHSATLGVHSMPNAVATISQYNTWSKQQQRNCASWFVRNGIAFVFVCRAQVERCANEMRWRSGVVIKFFILKFQIHPIWLQHIVLLKYRVPSPRNYMGAWISLGDPNKYVFKLKPARIHYPNKLIANCAFVRGAGRTNMRHFHKWLAMVSSRLVNVGIFFLVHIHPYFRYIYSYSNKCIYMYVREAP